VCTLLLGIFTEKEQKIFENIDTIYNKWFVPIIWATGLVARARQQGKIKDDIYAVCLIDVSICYLYYLCHSRN